MSQSKLGNYQERGSSQESKHKTGDKRKKQAQLGMPHSRIQIEFGFLLQAGTCHILYFAQNLRQSQSVQGTELNWGGGTPHRKSVYREGGTPHIFSEQGALAENPRWSPSVANIS